jgi:hypothetical protein
MMKSVQDEFDGMRRRKDAGKEGRMEVKICEGQIHYIKECTKKKRTSTREQ